MKKIITVQEVEGQGLEALLGKEVILFCINYNYAGVLAGVNTHDVILEKPKKVFDTGPFHKKGFSDAQELPADEWRVRTAAIESYGEMS